MFQSGRFHQIIPTFLEKLNFINMRQKISKIKCIFKQKQVMFFVQKEEELSRDSWHDIELPWTWGGSEVGPSGHWGQFSPPPRFWWIYEGIILYLQCSIWSQILKLSSKFDVYLRFAIWVGQIQSKLILSCNLLVRKLQDRKLVSIEFALPKRQNVFPCNILKRIHIL